MALFDGTEPETMGPNLVAVLTAYQDDDRRLLLSNLIEDMSDGERAALIVSLASFASVLLETYVYPEGYGAIDDYLEEIGRMAAE